MKFIMLDPPIFVSIIGLKHIIQEFCSLIGIIDSLSLHLPL